MLQLHKKSSVVLLIILISLLFLVVMLYKKNYSYPTPLLTLKFVKNVPFERNGVFVCDMPLYQLSFRSNGNFNLRLFLDSHLHNNANNVDLLFQPIFSRVSQTWHVNKNLLFTPDGKVYIVNDCRKIISKSYDVEDRIIFDDTEITIPQELNLRWQRDHSATAQSKRLALFQNVRYLIFNAYDVYSNEKYLSAFFGLAESDEEEYSYPMAIPLSQNEESNVLIDQN